MARHACRTRRATSRCWFRRMVLECSSQAQASSLSGWKPLAKYSAKGPGRPEVEGSATDCRLIASGRSVLGAFRFTMICC